MQDKRLKNDIHLIVEHINEIESYFEEVKSPEDFILTKQGRAYYDAILMHLQVTGEN